MNFVRLLPHFIDVSKTRRLITAALGLVALLPVNKIIQLLRSFFFQKRPMGLVVRFGVFARRGEFSSLRFFAERFEAERWKAQLEAQGYEVESFAEVYRPP